MGKKGKRSEKLAAKKAIDKRLNALIKTLEEELKGADLFAPLPPTDDCAVCLMPLSRISAQSQYHACCGNYICDGCGGENKAVREKKNKKNGKQNNGSCPFCRAPESRTAEEFSRRLKVRISLGDHAACCMVGSPLIVSSDISNLQDKVKGLSYFILAIELGSAEACTTIYAAYKNTFSVELGTNKRAVFYRAGALRGCVRARYNIGGFEYYTFGKHELGIRHWKIAAEAGMQPALDQLKAVYNANGKKPGKEFISKEYLDQVYRVCHDAQEEVKSEEREKHRKVEDKWKC